MPNTLDKPRTATMTLKLDTSHRDRLKSLAVATKRSAHYLMKEAIERYLKAEEAQQAALQSVDDSVAHFEATGLHITLNELKTWAKDVKENRNAQLPACHT
jgi:predicted transcriptional regulator